VRGLVQVQQLLALERQLELELELGLEPVLELQL
jgi:hypothetical protein